MRRLFPVKENWHFGCFSEKVRDFVKLSGKVIEKCKNIIKKRSGKYKFGEKKIRLLKIRLLRLKCLKKEGNGGSFLSIFPSLINLIKNIRKLKAKNNRFVNSKILGSWISLSSLKKLKCENKFSNFWSEMLWKMFKISAKVRRKSFRTKVGTLYLQKERNFLFACYQLASALYYVNIIKLCAYKKQNSTSVEENVIVRQVTE